MENYQCATHKLSRWLLSLLLLLAAFVGSAQAASVQVWVQPSGDTFATAYAITGEARTYFGRVEGGGGAYEYKWEFSDGVGDTGFAAVSDPRFISIDAKSFTSAGTQWAKLTVRDTADPANQASAQIDLQVIAVADDNLNRQKNSAIDRGLRYTYQQENRGCNTGGTGGTVFENYGPNEAAVYGIITGNEAVIQSTYYFGATVCPGTFTVDWGDGTIENFTGESTYCGYPYAYIQNLPHTYGTGGIYTISVSHDGTTTNPFITVDVTDTGGTSNFSCWPGGYYYGGNYPIGATGMALVAFENHGHNLQAPDSDIYKKSVQRGIQYLLDNASNQVIGSQANIGNPEANDGDSDADNKGVLFGNDDMYTASIAVLALVNSCDENFAKSTIAVTPGDVNGMSLWDIAVDAKDWLAWAQNENGSGRGGWRYSSNSWDSDNSVTQWPVLALSEAKNRWNINVNPLVITELNTWLAYSQNANGAFGYSAPWDWLNFPKTAAGLIMLNYGGTALAADPVQNALGYLDDFWGWTGQDGNIGSQYSMYAFYKAMKIWKMHDFYGRDWEQLYDQWLIANQATANTWTDQGIWEDTNFATYSALAILAPEVAGLPPVANAGAPYAPINGGQSLQLDGSKSYHQDPAKNISLYQWDFDAANGLWWDTKPAPDAGEGAVGMKPFVTYPIMGSNKDYTVTLRVTDDGLPVMTDTDTAVISVTTGNVPPVPVTNGPWSGLPSDDMLFDATASYDPNACTTAGDPKCLGDSIVSYEWDLDADGLYNEANGDDGTQVLPNDYRKVTKSFPSPISLPARLRVTDSFGLQATSANNLNIVSIAVVFGRQYETCFRVVIDRFTERLGLRVKFKNQGNAAADNLLMTLTSAPTNLTILKAVSSLGTLAAGQEAYTACDPTAKTADIELRSNRRIVPTGNWTWQAKFNYDSKPFTVDNIPPLGP